jgi:hypothetical protein
MVGGNRYAKMHLSKNPFAPGGLVCYVRGHFKNAVIKCRGCQPWSNNLAWKVDWDSLTHMAPIPDVRPAVAMITAGDYAGARENLAPIRAGEIQVLDERLDDLSETLDGVNTQVRTVK